MKIEIKNGPDTETMKTVIKFIKDCNSGKISVETIADYIFKSRSRTYEMIKEYSGMDARSFINKIKFSEKTVKVEI